MSMPLGSSARDAIIVLHRIRRAEAALAVDLADRMDRHQPDDIDAELFRAGQLRLGGSKRSFARELPRVDLIKNGTAAPVYMSLGTTLDRPHLSAPNTIAHQNFIWANVIAPVARLPRCNIAQGNRSSARTGRVWTALRWQAVSGYDATCWLVQPCVRPVMRPCHAPLAMMPFARIGSRPIGRTRGAPAKMGFPDPAVSTGFVHQLLSALPNLGDAMFGA